MFSIISTNGRGREISLSFAIIKDGCRKVESLQILWFYLRFKKYLHEGYTPSVNKPHL